MHAAAIRGKESWSELRTYRIRRKFVYLVELGGFQHKIATNKSVVKENGYYILKINNYKNTFFFPFLSFFFRIERGLLAMTYTTGDSASSDIFNPKSCLRQELNLCF